MDTDRGNVLLYLMLWWHRHRRAAESPAQPGLADALLARVAQSHLLLLLVVTAFLILDVYVRHVISSVDTSVLLIRRVAGGLEHIRHAAEKLRVVAQLSVGLLLAFLGVQFGFIVAQSHARIAALRRLRWPASSTRIILGLSNVTNTIQTVAILLCSFTLLGNVLPEQTETLELRAKSLEAQYLGLNPLAVFEERKVAVEEVSRKSSDQAMANLNRYQAHPVRSSSTLQRLPDRKTNRLNMPEWAIILSDAQ